MIYIKIVAGRVTDRALFDAPMPDEWPDRDQWQLNDTAQIDWTLVDGELVPPEPEPRLLPVEE